MKIAHYKMAEVVRILTQAQTDKISQIKKDIDEKAAEVLKEGLPPEVLSFDAKYPGRLAREKNLRLTTATGSFWIYPKCPKVTEFATNQDKLLKKLERVLKPYFVRLERIRGKKQTLKGSLLCALKELGTYKAVKRDFPEAYKILVEEVDGVKQETVGCVDISELRKAIKK